MQIGAVARGIAVSARAIRIHERSALWPHRTAGGFRRDDKGDVKSLLCMRRVEGLTLDEIRGLLGRSKWRACRTVRRRLKQKLASVCGKLRDLERPEEERRSALPSCDRELQKRSGRSPLLKIQESRTEESAR